MEDEPYEFVLGEHQVQGKGFAEKCSYLYTCAGCWAAGSVARASVLPSL